MVSPVNLCFSRSPQAISLIKSWQRKGFLRMEWGMIAAHDSRIYGQHLPVQALKGVIIKLDSTRAVIIPTEIRAPLCTCIQEKRKLSPYYTAVQKSPMSWNTPAHLNSAKNPDMLTSDCPPRAINVFSTILHFHLWNQTKIVAQEQ